MLFQCAVPNGLGFGLGFVEQVTSTITYPGFDCDPMTQVCGTGPAGPGTGPVNIAHPPGGSIPQQGAVTPNILDLTWGPSIGVPVGTNPGGPAQPGHRQGTGMQTWGTPDGTGGVGVLGVFKLPDFLTPRDMPLEMQRLLGILFWAVIAVGGIALLSAVKR